MSQPRQSADHKRRRVKPYQIWIVIFAAILFLFFLVPNALLLEEGLSTQMPDRSAAFAMENGMVYKQPIENVSGSMLRSIDIKFGTYGRTNRGNLDVKLYEDDNEIASWSVPTQELQDDALRAFTLDTPHTMKRGSEYSFTLCDTYRGRNKISVWMNRSSTKGFYLDDQYHATGMICYSETYGNTRSMTVRILAIRFVILTVAVALFFAAWENRQKIGCRCNAIMLKWKPLFRFRSRELTVWDWIIFGVLAGFCYFSMQQGDIIHTGACSFTLLKGHLRDFYEYNATHLNGNNYMLTTYIMFAIWNIPLALLGLMDSAGLPPVGMVMWYKGLPTTLFIVSGILFYKICKKYEDKTGFAAKWGAFAFLLTPTAFYSQFIFGQYDALTTFFMVLGLKLLLDEKEHSLEWFSLIFGIATTCKYHALLFYVPILVYKEKRLPKLIKNAIIYFLPIVLVNLPFIHSPAFAHGVEGFGAVDYFFAASVGYYLGDVFRIYIVPLLWVVVCAYAYTRKTAEDAFDRLGEISFLTGMVVWLAFGVVFWHPQWLMIATPFLALGLVTSNRRNIICLLDTVYIVAFLSFVDGLWRGLTQTFFDYGVFKDLVYGRLTICPVTLQQFCLLKDRNLAFTVLSCILLVRALLLLPRWKSERNLCAHAVEQFWFRVRGFVGICVLVVPMVVCLIAELHTPTFFSSVRVDEANGKVLLSVQSDADFGGLMAAVWSNAEGQDDLKWYPMEKVDENVYQYVIDLDNHKTLGDYYVHYYYHTDEVPTMLTPSGFTISSLPDSIQPQIEAAT